MTDLILAKLPLPAAMVLRAALGAGARLHVVPFGYGVRHFGRHLRLKRVPRALWPDLAAAGWDQDSGWSRHNVWRWGFDGRYDEASYGPPAPTQPRRGDPR